jgi:hypothetical protein
MDWLTTLSALLNLNYKYNVNNDDINREIQTPLIVKQDVPVEFIKHTTLLLTFSPTSHVVLMSYV